MGLDKMRSLYLKGRLLLSSGCGLGLKSLAWTVKQSKFNRQAFP